MSLCYKKEGYAKRVKGETIGILMKEGVIRKQLASHEGRVCKASKGETIGFPLLLVSPYQNQPDFIDFLRRVVLRLLLRFPPF